jgi:hypothetical protein
LQITAFNPGLVLNGTTTINFKLNQQPYNGTCEVDLYDGYALETNFQITCANWYDIDGYITRYEYFAMFANDTNPIALNFNPDGILQTQLPQGPVFDSYNVSLFVQIIDDDDAIAVYNIPIPVTVRPQEAYISQIEDEIISGNGQSDFYNFLVSDDLQICSRSIISFTSMLNFQTGLTVRPRFKYKYHSLLHTYKT